MNFKQIVNPLPRVKQYKINSFLSVSLSLILDRSLLNSPKSK